MRISHEHKLIFLAYPRTGSTTVRALLDPHAQVASVHVTETSPDFPFYHHITARELKAVFEQRGWDWSVYRKFCVVRNPFDRVVSLYHHKLRSLQEPPHGRGPLYRLARQIKYVVRPLIGFADYVAQLDPEHGLTASLRAFTCDAAGAALVPDVLLFERLREQLPAYLAGAGLPVSAEDIRHLNASEQRKRYRDYYDEHSQRRVAQLYACEIERFGYRF